MARVYFRPDPAGIRAMFLAPQGPVQSHLLRKALAVRARAQVDAPRGKTGKLARSITVVRFRNGYAVTAAVPYSLYVHEGTRPRIIRARRAKALRWETELGEVVFARWVRHPGSRANPFLRRALEAEIAQAA